MQWWAGRAEVIGTGRGCGGDVSAGAAALCEGRVVQQDPQSARARERVRNFRCCVFVCVSVCDSPDDSSS